MANRFSVLAAVLLILGLGISQAAVTPLYEANIVCQSQADAERQLLFKQGLIQVLEKLSGETGFEKDQNVIQAFSRISDYVEQYAYLGDQLNVRYSTDLINRLMSQSGHHAVWGQRRPNVIFWLAVEDNQQQRHLVGAETDPILQAQIEKWATEKGLPLLLPLMDLEDVSSVSVTDIWGQFPNTLQRASKRYDAQVILVARLSHTPGAEKPWSANWQLFTANENPNWTISGFTQDEVLIQGISSTSHYMMGRFGQKNLPRTATSDKPFLVAVDNVQNANDYTNVEKYLSSIQPANAVNIQRIDGAMAVFEITPRSGNGREAFEQALQLEHHLQREQTATAMFSEGDLMVRWSP